MRLACTALACASFAVACGAALPPSVARAWEAPPARRAVPSPFFRGVREPGYARAHQLFLQGLEWLVRLD